MDPGNNSLEGGTIYCSNQIKIAEKRDLNQNLQD